MNRVTVKFAKRSSTLSRYEILLLPMFLNHKKPLKIPGEILLKQDYVGKMSFEDVAYSSLSP